MPGRGGRGAGATRVVGLVPACLVVAGCVAVGPDFVRPAAPPLAPQWMAAEDPRVKQEPSDHREWWKAFNDPVLDRLIEDAYQQSLTLQAAGLRVLEARAQLGIAIGSLYPQTQQVFGQALYTRASESRGDLPGGDRTFVDYAAGLNVAWELDLWGRFRRTVESADATMLATVAQYDDVLVSLTGDVATAYLTIRTFAERLRIAEENVKAQEEALRLARARFRTGATTELDVQQAASLLLNTRATIPQLTISRQQALQALGVLLGRPAAELIAVLGQGRIPDVPSTVAVGIPADLLRRRPDVQLAELQAAAQSAQIGVARGDLFPRLSLLGSIGLRTVTGGGVTVGDFFDLGSIEVLVGPSLTWDIFNYGRLKDNVRVQDARLQQLLVTYQDTVLRAAQEVESNLIGFLQGQDTAGLLAEAVKASTRSVQLALRQYRAGTADFQRVIDAERVLLDQQDRLAVVRGSVITSLVGVYRALGGGWQLREGKPFLPEPLLQQMRERTDWGGLIPPETPPPEPMPTPAPARQRSVFPAIDR